MVWMHHVLFNHSPIEEHLGSFQFGRITNKGAVNIHLQDFV